MASGDLRIFGDPPRPSRRSAPTNEESDTWSYRPSLPCRTVIRPGLILLAKAPGWSGEGARRVVPAVMRRENALEERSCALRSDTPKQFGAVTVRESMVTS